MSFLPPAYIVKTTFSGEPRESIYRRAGDGSCRLHYRRKGDCETDGGEIRDQ